MNHFFLVKEKIDIFQYTIDNDILFSLKQFIEKKLSFFYNTRYEIISNNILKENKINKKRFINAYDFYECKN